MFAPAAAAARKRGMGLVRVEFSFFDDPAFIASPPEKQLSLIAGEGRALVEVLGKGPSVLVGKALGTTIMGAMVGLVDPRTRWVWMTPALKDTGLLERMLACAGPSLSLIGSEDGSVDITRSDKYLFLPGITHFEFEGFNHTWNHPSGADEEARSLAEIGRIFDHWLDGSAAS
jgi:hypothetical protein